MRAPKDQSTLAVARAREWYRDLYYIESEWMRY